MWFASFLFLAAGAQPADAAPESGDWGASASFSIETAYIRRRRLDSDSFSYILAGEVSVRPQPWIRTGLRLMVDQSFWLSSNEDKSPARFWFRDVQLFAEVPELTGQDETWVRTSGWARVWLPTSKFASAFERLFGVELGGSAARSFLELGPGDLELRFDLSLRKNFAPRIPSGFVAEDSLSLCALPGTWLRDRLFECTVNDLQILGAVHAEYVLGAAAALAVEIGISRRYIYGYYPPNPSPRPSSLPQGEFTGRTWVTYSSLELLIAPDSWLSGGVGATTHNVQSFNRDGMLSGINFFPASPVSYALHARLIFTL